MQGEITEIINEGDTIQIQMQATLSRTQVENKRDKLVEYMEKSQSAHDAQQARTLEQITELNNILNV